MKARCSSCLSFELVSSFFCLETGDAGFRAIRCLGDCTPEMLLFFCLLEGRPRRLYSLLELGSVPVITLHSLHPGQDDVCSGVSCQTSTGLNYSIATGSLEALWHVVQIAMCGNRQLSTKYRIFLFYRIYVLWIHSNAFFCKYYHCYLHIPNLCH